MSYPVTSILINVHTEKRINTMRHNIFFWQRTAVTLKNRNVRETCARLGYNNAPYFLITRAHSFPWTTEFLAEPQNLPFSAEF